MLTTHFIFKSTVLLLIIWFGKSEAAHPDPTGATPCTTNDTCSDDQTCLGGFCVNACEGVACSDPHSKCEARNHGRMCVCDNGYVLGPEGCMPKEKCESNSTCPGTQACVDGFCDDLCQHTKCPDPNSHCIVANHQQQCQCNDGFEMVNGMCVLRRTLSGKMCVTNDTCALTEACIDGACGDPCIGSRCSAHPNTICVVINHYARCRCKAGYVYTKNGCVLACKTDSDCNEIESCYEGFCFGICKYTKCPDPNSKCMAKNHKPRCICKQGYVEKNGACVIQSDRSELPGKTCSSNNNCSPKEVCLNGICSDACKGAKCDKYPNTECVVIDHIAKCKCKAGYIYTKKGCVLACKTDNDCSLENACDGGYCIEPCKYSKCPKNSDCITKNHRPECNCKKGYFLKNGACVKPSGKPCSSNDTCSPKEFCTDGFCNDVCKGERCDKYPNTVCVAIDHIAKCKCKTGYVYTKTGCVLACKTDNDCRDIESCYEGYCVDICKYSKCPNTFVCVVEKHKPKCHCKAGYYIKNGVCVSGNPCTSNNDCSPEEACEKGFCMNPCEGAKCEEPNTECKVENHVSSCICKPGYVPGKDGCVKAGKPCTTDQDCDSAQTCINGYCNDPCKFSKCPDTFVCLVKDHKPLCVCQPGYAIKNGVCVPGVPCTSNDTCAATEACMEGVCSNPCEEARCNDPNTQCTVKDHIASCNCKPGYVPGKDGCVPASGNPCTRDDDCESTKACLNGYCNDPCQYSECKAANSQCFVVNHKTQCRCKEGYERVEGSEDCVLKERPTGKPCTSNDTCGAKEACIDGVCSSPCEGAKCERPNTECTVSNHVASCTCKPGYVPGKDGCEPAPGKACTKNDDCDSAQTCKNGYCDDPCKYSDCKAGNSECYAQNHIGMCRCKDGYVRVEGKEDCVPKEKRPGKQCTSNSDCSSTEACIDEVCGNPCDGAKCGRPNTECSVKNHAAVCVCKPGYVSGKDGCEPAPGKPCTNDNDCDSTQACKNGYCDDPCKYSQCKAGNSECYVTNHVSSCRCKEGYVRVEGKEDCVPKENRPGKPCTSNDECRLEEACIDGICSNPCTGAECTQPNTECTVNNHKASCTCKSGYVPGENGCKPAPGKPCTNDNDCESTKACLDGYCDDPCKVGGKCTDPNSECKVINHVVQCICKPGYVAGSKGCEPAKPPGKKCLTDNECPIVESCNGGYCMDPCKISNCPYENTECYVKKHRPFCRCKPGFFKSKTNHRCEPIKGPHGKRCKSNSDCSAQMACVYGVCTDPCSMISCGENAFCSVTLHEPVCNCYSGYAFTFDLRTCVLFNGTATKTDVIQIVTNNTKRYKYYPLPDQNVPRLDISLRGTKNAEIALTYGPGNTNPMYEVVIGAHDNMVSAIRYNHKEKARENTPKVITSHLTNHFIVSWENGLVQVRRGDNGPVLVQWQDPKPFKVSYFGLRASEGGVILWSVKNT